MLLEYESTLRILCFLGVFIIMATWEFRSPRRTLLVKKSLRWSHNLGMVAINTILLRIIFPTAAVGYALFVESAGWGLFNYFALPTWLTLILCLVALDLFIYLQHAMFHALPLLWRLHRVHHADLDYDVTTGARFHPIEILLSMLIKLAAITVLGAPAIAVLIFEVMLNAMAMFNHANISLPKHIDRWVRYVFVTPDMHRVHHSIHRDETDSNFGFNLSIWDRLFFTYKAQPKDGHDNMVIGIPAFRQTRECVSIPAMLILPFKSRPPRQS